MIPILLIFFSSISVVAGPAYPTATDETRQVIIEKAQESIESTFDPEEYRFTLTARWIQGSLLKAQPEHVRSVKLQGTVEQYTNFEVLYLDGNSIEQVQIQLKVEAEQKLPVPNQRMMSGQTIEPGDLSWRWVPVRMGRDKPVRSMEELAGKTLRRTVNPGQPIHHSEISTPFLVEAGEDVDLIFTEFGIQIILTCEARQNGAIDEEIQIYCKETRNKYLGTVKGPGEALWQKTH
ncbi:flagellar basal body P-ring formation chaperone FlgA [Gracilimonas sediminicola]|uniref:Flagella basal body P-ring formation protein FlgA n=1 Tax=Gracilimonas sediminicola TaxID=2952158 RepID=A0A9X2L3U7_9BACT|nr:flagellar basal body P-ring formation chaperone FlgA [Gracilimonas sediminicola]